MSCPDCHGEGRIECSGVHPRRLGGVSVMETPDTWTERCETCDGTGDRRERERTALDRVWDEDERTANLAMNRGQTIRRMQAEIDRLVVENRELRSRVTGVGTATVRLVQPDSRGGDARAAHPVSLGHHARGGGR